jgi:L-asparaginase
LLAAVAGLPAVLRGRELVSEQLAQVDSKDMSFAVWRTLALRCAQWLADAAVQGIVITHGTDTLEETAWFLQSLLNPGKPVVLTCAMRPATALSPDGPQNILDAVTVALDPRAQGVVAVCAGVVHSARDVRKDHPYRLDAFSSGDAGPLGFVEEKAVRWLKPEGKAVFSSVGWSSDALESIVRSGPWPRVEIVMNYAGASGAMVDLLVRDGVSGLVAAGTGNGSLHMDLEAALIRAQAAGVKVLRATRCAQGRVLPRPGDLIADSDGLSPVKARVALQLALLGAPAAGPAPS